MLIQSCHVSFALFFANITCSKFFEFTNPPCPFWDSCKIVETSSVNPHLLCFCFSLNIPRFEQSFHDLTILSAVNIKKMLYLIFFWELCSSYSKNEHNYSLMLIDWLLFLFFPHSTWKKELPLAKNACERLHVCYAIR